MEDGGATVPLTGLQQEVLALLAPPTLAGGTRRATSWTSFTRTSTSCPRRALIRAAVAKDPGFTPVPLLRQLKRRGRYRPEEIARLSLAVPFDLVEAKTVWRAPLPDAHEFIRQRPHEEVGCL